MAKKPKLDPKVQAAHEVRQAKARGARLRAASEEKTIREVQDAAQATIERLGLNPELAVDLAILTSELVCQRMNTQQST